MEPSITFDRALVTVQLDDVVHVMLELTAPSAPIDERRPFDVVTVLDRSGSMDGEPLDAVKHATKELVRRLGPTDRLGVVTFDDEVAVALGLEHHDADAASQAIAAIDSGGSTNLSGGWLKAFELLGQHGRPDALRRIVLLSDGMANAGIVDAAALAGLASGANTAGVSTSTIGFGDHYDDALMSAMADAGAGNDYFCGGPDQALAVFADELTGLASVVAQNISVELRPSDAVAEWAVLNEYPITTVPGGVQVNLGDAYGDERRRVVAMLRIVPQEQVGPLTVGELVIRWASTVGAVAMHTVTIPLHVGVSTDGPDAIPVDPAVVEQVHVLQAAAARREADAAIKRGDHRAASVHFSLAADTLAAYPAMYADVAELRTDAERALTGDVDENMRKRHWASQRQTTKGRRTRYDDPDQG